MGRSSNIRLGRPRSNPTLSEPYVYHALAEGRSEDEIALSLGITRHYLVNFVAVRRDRWKTNPPAKLVDDERRIVITREAFVGNAYRTITISLPRNSMHLLARSEARDG